MATTVHDHDVFAWAQQETSALEQARPQRSPRAARAKTPPPPTRPQPPAARSARGG
jgi:hypothetical protein